MQPPFDLNLMTRPSRDPRERIAEAEAPHRLAERSKSESSLATLWSTVRHALKRGAENSPSAARNLAS